MTNSTTKTKLTGTCSFCLGRFAVKGNGVALHGYKRPGYGAISGRCPGVRYPAFEISPEGTAAARDGYLVDAADARALAGRLQDGTFVETVEPSYRYGNGKRTVVAVTLSAASAPEAFEGTNYSSWEGLVAVKLKYALRRAEACASVAATFDEKVRTWTPGEFVAR